MTRRASSPTSPLPPLSAPLPTGHPSLNLTMDTAPRVVYGKLLPASAPPCHHAASWCLTAARAPLRLVVELGGSLPRLKVSLQLELRWLL
jgi:hypothetical protein